MKKLFICLAVMVALLVGAPWWLPARWVVPRLANASLGELSLTEVRGSLVEGDGRLLIGRAGVDSPVRWTASPFSRQVTLKVDEQGSVKLAYANGAVGITSEGVLVLPLHVSLPMPGAPKLAATAQLRDLKGQWARGQWQGSAALSASDTRLENRIFPLPLGLFNARLSESGALEGTLDGAWLSGKAQGQLTLSDRGAHGALQGSASIKRALPPALANLLPNAPNGQSNLPFDFKF